MHMKSPPSGDEERSLAEKMGRLVEVDNQSFLHDEVNNENLQASRS